MQDALFEIHHLKDVSDALWIAKQSADKAESRAQARYEAGVASFMELLDTQRTANLASIAFNNARENELNAVVHLMKALGVIENSSSK